MIIIFWFTERRSPGRFRHEYGSGLAKRLYRQKRRGIYTRRRHPDQSPRFGAQLREKTYIYIEIYNKSKTVFSRFILYIRSRYYRFPRHPLSISLPKPLPSLRERREPNAPGIVLVSDLRRANKLLSSLIRPSCHTPPPSLKRAIVRVFVYIYIYMFRPGFQRETFSDPFDDSVYFRIKSVYIPKNDIARDGDEGIGSKKKRDL